MADNSILIEFLLEDGKFTADVKKSAEEIEKLKGKIKDTKKPTKDVTDGLKDWSAGIAGAAAKFTALASAVAAVGAAFFFDKAIKSAAETQTALADLAGAMASVGTYSRASLNSMRAFADELQNTANVADEVSLGALALAKRLGLTDEQAKKVVSTAANMSKALGTDLQENVKQLSETYGGNLGKLEKLNPKMHELDTAAKATGGAVDILARQFEGAAANGMQTFDGRLKSVGLGFDDFAKSIGNLVVNNPAVLEVLKALKDAFKTMSDVVDNNAGTLRTFIGETLRSVVKNMRDAVIAVRVLGEAFGLIDANDPFANMEDSAGTFRDILRETADIAVRMADGILAAQEGYLKLRQLIEKASPSRSFLSQENRDSFVGPPSPTPAEKSQAQITAIEALRQGLANAVTKVATPNGDKYASELDGAPGKHIDNKSGITGALTKLLDSLDNLIDSGKVTKGTASTGGAEPKNLKPVGPNMPPDDLATGFFVPLLNKFQDSFAPAMSDLISNIGGGKDGANKFVANIGSGMATLFGAAGPVAGGIGQALQLLGQDPENFKEMINGFIKGIPQIIDNIVQNIPVVAQAIADHSDKIILAIAAGGPRIAYAISKAIGDPRFTYNITKAFVDDIIQGFNYYLPQMKVAGEHLSYAGKLAGDKLQSGGDKFNNALRTSFPDAIKKAGMDFSHALQTFFASIPAVISRGINGLIQGIKDASFGISKGLQEAPKAFSTAVQSIANGFGRAATSVTSAIENGGRSFGTAISEAGKSLTDIIGGAGERILAYFDAIPEKVGAALDVVASQFDGVFSGIPDAIKRAGDQFEEAIRNSAVAFYNDIVDAVKLVADSVTGNTGGGGNGYASDTYHKGKDYVTDRLGLTDSAPMDRALVSSKFPGASGAGGATDSLLLAQIVNLLQQPMTVQTKATVDGRGLADILLTMSRTNQRTRV